MKPFHTIAIPHEDIIDGKLTMDVFAADLWEVSQDEGLDEYKDADTFFRKTFITEGLKNILKIVQKRLGGKGGDAVIQLQTPFGGGKTHALIALYHKAVAWNAKRVVIVGTAMDARTTLWGEIEKQLTGSISKMSENTAPGKQVLKSVIEGNEPVLILMDEVLEYVTKAAGVTVGDSTLAAQTLAFMQELTELAGNIKGLCVVMTLPSSALERYDELAEKQFQQLQKVSGRVEMIYTPVQDIEITSVIRARLFQNINDDEVKEVVTQFVEFADGDRMLPVGEQQSEYRDRFLKSYPFLPEVVEMLYHRWGSFTTFQRTRGVLRLLSLVIASMAKSKEPYISPADFDLANQSIRHELLKHIGQEYNGIIDVDITNKRSNAHKVNKQMGKAYIGLGLGARAATTIFLHSFSGGPERGITKRDTKRCASVLGNPPVATGDAIEKLEDHLFFLQTVNDKHFFSNQPNINRIVLTIMDNISSKEVDETERTLLENNIDGGPLRVFLWEEDPSNIPDNPSLKLVILNKKSKKTMDEILKIKGQTPRVYRNTIFFLYPEETERVGFNDTIKHIMAYERLLGDRTQNLSDDQKEDIKKELRKRQKRQIEALQRLYRKLSVPVKDGTTEIDFGIPTPGDTTGFAKRVYDRLRENRDILEKIAPLVLQKKYLGTADFVSSENIYESSLRTPGEPRPVSKEVFERCIEEGVSAGLFGLGAMIENRPVCHYFEEPPSVALSDNEVVMSKESCIKQRDQGVVDTEQDVLVEDTETTTESGLPVDESGEPIPEHEITKLHMKFRLPNDKLSDVLSVIRLLQTKFGSTKLAILFEDGGMSKSDFEDKVEEAFTQMGIDLERV